MKKIIFIISFLLAIQYNVVYADTNEIIKEQEGYLGISSFIKEAENYTKDNLSEIDINEMYKSAISGKMDTSGIGKAVFKIIGKESLNTLKTLGYVLIIIIIHGIIKSVNDGLDGGETGKITYYVQYILIVTLVMNNFTEVITMVKDTVNNLVGFLDSLLPLLLTLMVTTGNITTASTIEPILLGTITIVRKCYIISFSTFTANWNFIWYNITNI